MLRRAVEYDPANVQAGPEEGARELALRLRSVRR
jgi:hypothetical protein